jgi:hypothetical protein
MGVIGITRNHKRQIADIKQAFSVSNPSGIDPQGVLARAMVHPIQRLTLGPQLLGSHSLHLRQYLKWQPGSSSSDANTNFSFPVSANQIRKTKNTSAKLVAWANLHVPCLLAARAPEHGAGGTRRHVDGHHGVGGALRQHPPPVRLRHQQQTTPRTLLRVARQGEPGEARQAAEEAIPGGRRSPWDAQRRRPDMQGLPRGLPPCSPPLSPLAANR